MSSTTNLQAERQGESVSAALLEAHEDEVRALVEGYLEQRRAGKQPKVYDLMLRHLPLAREVKGRLDLVDKLFRLGDSRKGRGEVGPGSPAEVRPDAPTLPAPGEVSRGPGAPPFIDRYLVREELGRGGQGVVYRALDTRLDYEVALKVLRPASAGTGQLLERDAQALVRLRHPNIVPLHAAGEDGDWLYVALALIDGETLETRLRRGPLAPTEAVVLVAKLAAALDYAHHNGVIHRDLKPSNVLLEARGPGQAPEPYLTDFGLARVVGAKGADDEAGYLLGTVAYMSPEQAQRTPHEADARSDVYGLGAVLFHALTGRRPVEGRSRDEMLSRVIHEPAPPPSRLSPNVPTDLDAICLKALAKDPAQRFHSAGEMADELGRWLRHEPLTVRPPRLWEVLWLWARRNRGVARTVCGAALMVLVVGAVFGGVAWVKHTEARAKDKEAQAAKQSQAVAEAAAILQARTRAEVEVHALLDKAQQRLGVPTQGRRAEAQEILRLAPRSRREIVAGEVTERLDLETRSTFAATLGVPEFEVVKAAALSKVDAPGVYPAAIHPDGQAMALVVGRPPRPLLWKIDEPLKLPNDVRAVEAWAWHSARYSPDGKCLALLPAGGGLELWDGDVTRDVDLEPGGKVPYLAVGFDREGKILCACRADGEVRCWSLPDGKPLERWKGEANGKTELTAAAFNAGATLLVVGDGVGRSRLRWPDGKSQPLPAVRGRVTALALAPDDRLVAVGTRDGTVQLWQRDDAGALPSYRLHLANVPVRSIVFHPAGQYVLAGAAGATRVWDVATGEQVLTGPDVPWGFARDGRRFAAGGPLGAAAYELAPAVVLRPLSGHAAQIEQLAWSRDHRHLVSLDASFVMHVWDVPRGTLVNEFVGPPGNFFATNAAAALSDDGGQLAYVNGGESRVVLWDVKTGKKMEEWKLAPGFERLACAGGSKFVLVREEAGGKGPGSSRTVAYEFAAGRPPREVREVRPPVQGEQMFFSSGLTPDGRYCWWAGPREPRSAYRVEVREVATSRLVTSAPYESERPVGDLGAFVSPDGRFLWAPTKGGVNRHDLSGKEPRERLTAPPSAVTNDARWWAYQVESREHRGTERLALRRGSAGGNWLELGNRDLSTPAGVSFSGDGRYLAWGSRSGLITVADLKALEEQVTAFENEVRPK